MPTLKLTKPVIDELTPNATDQVYWDKTLPGFGLKVTPAGRKVFIVMYRTADSRQKLRKYTIGPYGTLTLIMARTAAQKILLARLDGQDPAAEKQLRRKQPAGLTIDEAIARYKAEYIEPRGIGVETKRILDRNLLATWRGRHLAEINRGNVRDFIDEMVARGASGMAIRVFKVVHAMFNWCIGRGLLEASPCAGLAPPPSNPSRDRVLTDEELAKVLKAARQMPHPYGSLIHMLALTGQRRSEVAGMEWSELDLDKAVWTIPSRRTKTRRAHIVHLTPHMLAQLPDRQSDQSLVFSTANGKAFRSFNSLKKRLDAASGVSGWVIHDLRRTVATGMAALGIAPHVADKILNHQSGTISGIAAVYQRHEFLLERKMATEKWCWHVEAIMICKKSAEDNTAEDLAAVGSSASDF